MHAAALLLTSLARPSRTAAQDRAPEGAKGQAVGLCGGRNREHRASEALCDALGAQLGRDTVLVDDGSNVRRGDSLHIVQGDVAWTVIWLRDGDPRAFTRVSAADAAGREVLFLARALRVLIREANKPIKGCVRVEPNGGRPCARPISPTHGSTSRSAGPKWST